MFIGLIFVCVVCCSCSRIYNLIFDTPSSHPISHFIFKIDKHTKREREREKKKKKMKIKLNEVFRLC